MKYKGILKEIIGDNKELVWKSSGLLCVVVERPSYCLSLDPFFSLGTMLEGGRSTDLPDSYYCGYVFVPGGHPWCEKDYTEVCDDIDVHGDLTFSKKDGEGMWFGFDTAHAFSGKWTRKAAKKETVSLAKQLAKIGGAK